MWGHAIEIELKIYIAQLSMLSSNIEHGLIENERLPINQVTVSTDDFIVNFLWNWRYNMGQQVQVV